MPPDPELQALKRDFIKGVVVVILIGLVVVWVVREPALVVGRMFVETVGAPGVFVAFYVLDLVFLPIPHEAFSGLALFGGVGFWEVTAYATAGSILGGSTGFAISRRVGRTPWFLAMIERRGKKARRIVERHGRLGLVLGAISPLPYAPCTWAAGAFQFPWPTFLAISVLRLPRIAFYLWLIQLGLFHL